jgi:putative hydrolase of the HAD superfamily
LISPNGIQAILFDLDGTLRNNAPASFPVFLDYAEQLGTHVSPQARWQTTRWTHYYWAQSPELLQDSRFYGEHNDAFWTNYAARCLQTLGDSPERAWQIAPELHRYMKEEHQPADHIPPDVPKTLDVLKRAGFRLGVISNRDEPMHSYLEQIGLLPFLDLSLAAGEVGCWKPDPCIFTHGLQRLGCSPTETIYVGDNYYADILGARAAGLRPVLVDPDGLFPEAECPVIHSVGGLLDVLASS